MPIASAALDGHQIDPEKQRVSDDVDDSPYSTSDEGYSRDVGATDAQRPMLRRKTSATLKATKAALSYAVPRRRFNRCFSLVLLSVILLVILALTRASVMETARLAADDISNLSSSPPAFDSFPFLSRYTGGIRSLTPRARNKPEYPDLQDNAVTPELAADLEEQQTQPFSLGFQRRASIPPPTRFNPYPDYHSDAYQAEYEPVTQCAVQEDGNTTVPQLLAFPGVPSGFPDPVMGSHELFGLDNAVCFERHGRLGPYGYGYSRKWGGSGAGMTGDREGAEAVWGDGLEIDYRAVKWGDAQDRCAEKNKRRFKPHDKTRNHFFETMPSGGPDSETATDNQDAAAAAASHADADSALSKSGKKLLSRTAVIIRTWSDYNYDAEDIFYLRALINELSIQSGGEYTVHFLIHVKDNNLQIWSDDDTYQRVLDESLPAEFHGMGTLWSESQMSLVYAGLDEHTFRGLPIYGVYRSTYMPVQYFAHMHPEYDFFWHWEMDVRYTGHWYHLFDKVSRWAKKQPRKGLWERNGRFYVPAEHGSYDDFTEMVRRQTEEGPNPKLDSVARIPDEAAESLDPPIWGPYPPTGLNDHIDLSNDPIPPTDYKNDNYEWGVGEEADFITFNPLFNPSLTNWILAEDVTGYDTSDSFPPRRTAIITASRLSRRLLETMHRETAMQRHMMFAEMWPGSCALHHGLKAVYAPHPVYIDRKWPTSYLAAIFNNGKNGASGGARSSVFSDERQVNFLGTTWYYHAGFAGNLWKRWLGYKVDGLGGEEQEMVGEGRMCLPGVLLHPVKQVDLIYEHQAGQ